MSEQNRRELKEKFRTGAQPTEQDYADVIDSVLNKRDDGINKPAESYLPLRFTSFGSDKNILDFYDDTTHNWRINMLPDATYSGFNLTTGSGNSRLFVEQGAGDIGIGTTQPKAKLHVNLSGDQGKDAIYVEDAEGDTTPFRVSNSGNVYIKSGEDEVEDADLYVNGSINVVNETTNKSWLHINESGAVAFNGTATADTPYLEVNQDTKINGDLSISGKLIVEQELEIKATLSAEGQTILLGDHNNDKVSIPGKLMGSDAQALIIDDDVEISGSLAVQNGTSINHIATSTDNGSDDDKLLTENAINTYIHQILPEGAIIMWAGSQIPTGWALCDGNDGRPNLLNRFIVGAGADYQVHATGGENQITLTEAQMPAHKHSGDTSTNGEHQHVVDLGWKDFGATWGSDKSGNAPLDEGSNKQNTESAGSHSHSFETSTVGGSQSHENRPPYYALSYIIKTTSH